MDSEYISESRVQFTWKIYPKRRATLTQNIIISEQKCCIESAYISEQKGYIESDFFFFFSSFFGGEGGGLTEKALFQVILGLLLVYAD